MDGSKNNFTGRSSVKQKPKDKSQETGGPKDRIHPDAKEVIEEKDRIHPDAKEVIEEKDRIHPDAKEVMEVKDRIHPDAKRPKVKRAAAGKA